MITYAKVVSHGKSLVVVLTAELREMGLGLGDWVRISIEPMPKPALDDEVQVKQDESIQPIQKVEPSKLNELVESEPKNYFTKPDESMVRVKTEKLGLDLSEIAAKIAKITHDADYSDEDYKQMMTSVYGVRDGDVQTVLNLIKEKRT